MKAWVSSLSVVVALAGAPVAAQDRFTGDLCGNKADVVLQVPGPNANPELKKFFGVWGKGKWENNLCTALAVTEINGSIATIRYFYGAGSPPNDANPGSFVKTDAVMKGKYLFFKSLKGFDVSYELMGEQLMGWFGSIKLTERLQKMP